MLRRSLLRTVTVLATTALTLPASVSAQSSLPPQPVPLSVTESAAPLPEPPSSNETRKVAESRRVIAATNPNVETATQPAPLAPVRPAAFHPEIETSLVDVTGANKSMPQARLELSTQGPAVVAPGKPFSYSIHVRNVSTQGALNTRVSDKLPAGVRLVAAEPKPDSEGESLSWTLGEVPAGGEKTIRVQVLPDAGANELSIHPSVTFGSQGLRIRVAKAPLELSLKGPEKAPVGGVVPINLRIANNGPTSLDQVNVRVKLPAGLHHPNRQNGDAIQADVALAAGEVKLLPLELTAADAGTHQLSATVNLEGNVILEAKASIEVAATQTVAAVTPAKGDLSVALTHLGDRLGVGGLAAYEIRVVNAEATPRAAVRVSVELPEGMEAVQADGPTSAAAAPHGFVFESLPQLKSGEAAVFHVRARARKPGVQPIRVEVNAENLERPATAETGTWVAPGTGR